MDLHSTVTTNTSAAAQQDERAALLDEIIRLQTRVAQLEATALLDRQPAEALDEVADPVSLRRDQLLRATAIGVSSATGAAFFRLLARHLANTLDCDCALVGVLLPGEVGRIRSLAFFADRELLPTIEYDLAGTPCEKVVAHELCVHPAGVQRLFPEDQWLADWGIEAYAGTPLVNSRGEVLGLISVLSRQPLADPAAARSALQIFATRASAELERQQTEESLRASQAALAESEERFRQMAEAIRDIFWLYDVGAQRLLYISPAYEAVWGVKPDWLFENPFRWLEAVHEDDRAIAGSMPLPPPALGKVFDEVYRIRRPDGEIAWLHDRRYALGDSSGKCQRLVGVSEDITARRLAEERIAQQLAAAAHLARLSTVGELVASISHEVNQPLYAIANYSAAIQAALEGGDDPPRAQLQRLSGEINKAAGRAGDIIRRVRSYVGRGTQERAPIDLVAVVQDSVALIAAEARRQRVQIQEELTQPAAPVVADAVGIQQVLVNLLRNALESMTGGQTPQSVVVTIRPIAGHVEIAVADTGGGLSDEDLQNLFTPFYTTKPQGLGLGLPISKTIVEAHGGRIWAERNAGGGTTLRLVLPAATSQYKTG